MLKSIGLLMVAILMLAGCGSAPTQQQIATADYGSAPNQYSAERDVKAFFDRYLKDSGSAQYRFSEAQRGYMTTDAFEGRKLFAGYLLLVDVNAKNSYGGYTGWTSYQFLFNHDQMVRGVKVLPYGTLEKLF